MSVMAYANSLMLDFRCVIIPRFVFATGHAFDGEKLTDQDIGHRIGEVAADLVRFTQALRGWAMLETGTPASDPLIKKTVDFIRREVPKIDLVYNVSLSIIFLDKLGDSADEPLIQSLAVRLLACQGDRGGWRRSWREPRRAAR